MIIIIGLGNPGEQYKNTRHNVGFMAVNAFAEKNNFPEFTLQKKSNSLISEKPFYSAQGDEKIILVKPQTFMNDSGKAVKSIISNFKSQMNPTGSKQPNLVVIHDDIDLPVGKIKIIQERGSAGHKGVESIIQNIGNDGLVRFRIGIASPAEALAKEGREKAKKIVLKNFSAEEKKTIDVTVDVTVEALNLFIKKGLEKTMNEYNR